MLGRRSTLSQKNVKIFGVALLSYKKITHPVSWFIVICYLCYHTVIQDAT